jgi:hypothetical protein
MPVSLVAKLIAPMKKTMMGSVMQESSKDLDNIKAAAEA